MAFNNNLSQNNDYNCSNGILAGLFDIIKSILSLDKGDENSVGLLQYTEKITYKPKNNSKNYASRPVAQPEPVFQSVARQRTLGKVQMPNFLSNTHN